MTKEKATAKARQLIGNQVAYAFYGVYSKKIQVHFKSGRNKSYYLTNSWL
jgi:hypothetical protein